MPTYYFDVVDGARDIADPEGSELPDDEAAGLEAFRTAAELCHRTPSGRDRFISVRVRNSEGEAVYRADLSLRGYRT